MRIRALLPCALLLLACGDDETSGSPSSSAAASTAGTGASTSATSTGTGGSGATGSGGGGGQPVETVPWVYVGASDDSISVYLLDRVTGALTPQGKVDAGTNPSFLAADPEHRFLFAVNEGSDEVAGFSIDPATGLLTALNKKSSEGGGPAYVSVDKTGGWALVANYGGGTVAVLPIGGDGTLGDAVDVESPGQNAHLIRTDPSNAFAFVPCLGSDHVAQFHFDPATGHLDANTPPSVATAPGAGPRHLEFNPSQPVVYVINEDGDTVVTYTLDAAGTLTAIDTQPTLPTGADGASNFCADLHISPDGKFLYGSNRGHDSLAIYAVDGATGKLTVAGHQPTGGEWPRNFGIDPAGDILLVANQNSSTIVTFRVEHTAGGLTSLMTIPTDGQPAWVGVITQPKPR